MEHAGPLGVFQFRPREPSLPSHPGSPLPVADDCWQMTAVEFQEAQHYPSWPTFSNALEFPITRSTDHGGHPMLSFSHDRYQNALGALPVEFGVEDPLPCAQQQLALRLSAESPDGAPEWLSSENRRCPLPFDDACNWG
jgi:hypothetical protein